MELGARAKARVREALGCQLLNRLLVEGRALALKVRALVPGEAQPLEVAHEELGHLAALGPRVKVLDAQDQRSAHAAHGQPRHQGREDVAQVHASGRRGGKAPAHGAADTSGLHSKTPCRRYKD